MRFKLLGTKIHISFLFAAILALLIITDKSGNFLPFSVAVTLHEIAHLITMRIVRCNPKEINLIPASVQIVRDIAARPACEVAISFAGSLMNLCLFMIFYIFYLIWGNMQVLNFAAINLVLAVFNLLPVKGLDGGVIIYKLLCIKMPHNRAMLTVDILTVLTAVAFLVLGVCLAFRGGGNFSLIIMAIYLLLSVIIKL